ncbi:MAG: hypothetical protein SFU56_21525 [Capsulimonadales bacterium]|nr:hypothetical protein [Capsulimonadales bacterium]
MAEQKMADREELIRRFVAWTAGANPDGQELRKVARRLADSTARATPDETQAVLTGLASGLRHDDPEIGGIAAMAGGAVVENGGDPVPFARTLLRYLPRVLRQAAEFADACLVALPESSEEEASDIVREPSPLRIGGRILPDDIAASIISRYRRGYAAWAALDLWYLPTIACLSRSLELRRTAREDGELLALAERLAPIRNGGEFLRKMLLVLDDEPLLVVHPDAGQGYRCVIGGIADNFQLQTLLMDALIGGPPPAGLMARFRRRTETPPAGNLPGRRPHPIAVAVARGDGPQEADVPSVGAFDLYHWTAWTGDGGLPKGPDRIGDRIWGEGVPADLLPFEGVRVILLGPPAYERGWNTVRPFRAMSAYFWVTEALSAAELRDYLDRFAAAPRPGAV